MEGMEEMKEKKVKVTRSHEISMVQRLSGIEVYSFMITIFTVIFHLNFPSNPTHPLDLQSTGMEHINTEESGRSNGRKDSVCAQMGVSNIAGTEGWTMDPPAANEYAVDPKKEKSDEL